MERILNRGAVRRPHGRGTGTSPRRSGARIAFPHGIAGQRATRVGGLGGVDPHPAPNRTARRPMHPWIDTERARQVSPVGRSDPHGPPSTASGSRSAPASQHVGGREFRRRCRHCLWLWTTFPVLRVERYHRLSRPLERRHATAAGWPGLDSPVPAQRLPSCRIPANLAARATVS